MGERPILPFWKIVLAVIVAAALLNGCQGALHPGASHAATLGATWTQTMCETAPDCDPSSLALRPNGQVQARSRVDLVFWGAWWQTHSAQVRQLTRLFTARAFHGYAAQLGRSFGAASSSSFGRAALVTSDPLKAGYDGVLGNKTDSIELAGRLAARTLHGLGARDDVIVFPAGSSGATYGGCEGQHAQWQRFVVAVIGKDTAGTHCALDGLTVAATHEWAESVTDPFDSRPGWTDDNGNEIADLCSHAGTLELAGFRVAQFYAPGIGCTL